MTIFRSSIFLFAWLNLSGCDVERAAFAEACPEFSMGNELLSLSAERYEIGKRNNSEKSYLPKARDLKRCLTEQAVKLSTASGSIDELSRAVTSVCEKDVVAFEGEAITRQLERGNLDSEGPVRVVRQAAERFALARIVQVRAGECSKK